MIAIHLCRPDRAAAFLRRALFVGLVLTMAGAGCAKHDTGPAPPETAAPAPPAAMPTAEDRGHQKAGESAAPESEQSAFSNVESGEAERAASQRGHQSAGEQAPAIQPRGGE
jgi:hypothetical protein